DTERTRAAPHVVTEEAYRACHTLAGSSRMAEARHGIRLTAPLEHWVRKAFDSGVGLGNADLALLADCMNAMHSVAANLDESTGFFQSHGALLARIEQATDELEKQIVEAARAAKSPVAPDPAPVVNAAPAVAAPPASFPSPAAVAATPPASAPVPQPAADIVEDTVTDFDQDIAGIFTDEAVELIDAAQAGLAQWNENRSSVDGLVALKRPLHTLKGGARMAGLSPMGDLSHELETLLMQIDSGIIKPDDRAFSLAQSALDELARMRESVSSGKGVPTARGLIAKIQALAHPGSAAAIPAPAPAPAAPPPSVPVAAAPAPKPPPPKPEPPVVHAPPPVAAPAPKPAPSAPVLTAVPTLKAAPPPPPRLEPVPEPPVLAPVWSGDTSSKIVAKQAPAAEPPSVVMRAALKDPISAGFAKEVKDGDAADAPLLPPGAVPPGREPVAPSDRPELARVDAELLDQLLNNSGEAS